MLTHLRISGGALTKLAFLMGAGTVGGAAWLVLVREPHPGAILTGAGGALLLIGGHRANHGAGTPFDRMLDALLDRVWDGAILASIAWAARGVDERIAAVALIALGTSFLSSYVRARGAALGYTVEESHVTRGIRYALVVAGLAFGWLDWTLWAAATTSFLAVAVRTSQVAKEERA